MNWKETGHTYIGAGGDTRCERCGATESRAIHSKNMHKQLGLPFVEAMS